MKIDPDEYLATIPANDPNRPLLRRVVRIDGDALQAAAHRFLTLASVYHERTRYERNLHEPEPPYEERLRRLTAHLFTHQRPQLLAIPDDAVTVREYVRRFEALNQLRSLDDPPSTPIPRVDDLRELMLSL